MKRISYSLILFSSLILSWNCSTPETSKAPQKPNVLFIAIDDLRPQLNCYGESYMHTPNLDQIAANGRLFTNHFVQVPTCGASRRALLMGQYPTYRKHTSNQVIRDDLAEDKAQGLHTLPQTFRQKGYYTAGLGKISHYVDGKIYTYDGEGDGRQEMPDSWDTMWGPVDKWGTAWNAFFGYADGSNRNGKNKQGSPTEFVAEHDEELPDGLIAQKAIDELQQLKDKDQPFFMAVGFIKPHLPFVAPKKYWDLYEGKELPLSPNPDMPAELAPMSVHNSGEMFNNYQNQPEKGGAGKRLSDEYAMHLRRAYFAAVSYTDAQVGKVMQALRETGLDKNTIVVVWGDHGWHLGDHTIWGKHSLFDRALKSAFMIQTPNIQQAGVPSDDLVETVDIFPTLIELCKIETPNSLSGKSLVPILDNPDTELHKPALGFWKAGYSLRTPKYRFSKFKKDEEVYFELFDHDIDPNETQNLAKQEKYSQIVSDLEQKLTQLMPASYWESLK